MAASLRFELRAPGEAKVPLDTFAALTEHLSQMLGELDVYRSGGRSVQWVITGLEVGSAVVEVTGQPDPSQVADVAPLIVSDALEGLEGVLTGRRPPNYPRPAWDEARAIAEIVRESESRVAIRSNGVSIDLGPDVVLEEELRPQVVESVEEAVSTVEGSLDTVYVHERPHFELWDILHHRPVACEFDRSLLPSVRQGLGERVRVHGRIVFDTGGRPERIRELLSIQVLTDDATRPRARELRGLVPDLTKGLAPEEWVRRIRDAEG